MPTIEETIEFITIAHEGQKDAAGEPYYLHPIAVMNRLPETADLDVKLAALLHDILEDTDYTRDDLINMGYSERTVCAVEMVTNNQNPSKSGDKQKDYENKILSIISSGNRDAIMLKLADMSENADPDRLAVLAPERRTHFENKYSRPLQWLRAALS